jgi:hypothetical protein
MITSHRPATSATIRISTMKTNISAISAPKKNLRQNRHSTENGKIIKESLT